LLYTVVDTVVVYCR